MWDNKLTFKENIKAILLEYWTLLLGAVMFFGALLYRPYGADIQFLMDFLPILGGLFLLVGILRIVGRKIGKKEGKANIFWRLHLVILVAILLWAASLAAATGTMLSEAKRNPYVEGADVIILGVELSAEHNTAILDSRLKPTADYLKRNPDNLAILCGGAAPGEILTTAQYMMDYLVAAGIEKERLILEEESQTVPEAIDNAKKIVERLQGGKQTKPVGLISNEYQLYRGRKYAAKADMAFYKMCVSTPFDRLQPMNFFIREYFKIVPMWLGLR